MKLLTLNKKVKQQKRIAALFKLAKNSKRSKQFMDELEALLINELKTQDKFQITYRDFWKIPQKVRVKYNIHPKSPFVIHKKSELLKEVSKKSSK